MDSETEKHHRLTAWSLGFTGTRNGLTNQQYHRLYRWMQHRDRPDIAEFHHGCCLGADASAADLADRFWGTTVIHAHPCDLVGLTSANARRLSAVVHPVQPPLVRNRTIVDRTQKLLACPDGPERNRSGTWATVRYARRLGRPIVVLWPDGSLTTENRDGDR